MFSFAGGFQDATNVAANTITATGFHTGKYAYFLNAACTPDILAGGSYSILFYSQPSVPNQPASHQIAGLSFSASQNIAANWGMFLRINSANGDAIAIASSVAGGAVWNDPTGRNAPDKLGFAVAWDRTNRTVAGTPSRGSEWVAESYYNFTILKALQITPDVQIYINPVLAPNTRVAAVFSLRTTWNF
jgi:hypothetical protein